MNCPRCRAEMQTHSLEGHMGRAVTIDLLSPAETAKALGVSEADVITLLETGELKGKNIGATWRVTRAALNGYVAE